MAPQWLGLGRRNKEDNPHQLIRRIHRITWREIKAVVKTPQDSGLSHKSKSFFQTFQTNRKHKLLCALTKKLSGENWASGLLRAREMFDCTIYNTHTPWLEGNSLKTFIYPGSGLCNDSLPPFVSFWQTVRFERTWEKINLKSLFAALPWNLGTVLLKTTLAVSNGIRLVL